MPTERRSRTIPAPVQELWELVGDPHHLPRWWPRVTRVEDVEDDAFTEVMRTSEGRVVRADFAVLERDGLNWTLRWSQRVEGTPFARVLRSAETEVRLVPLGGDGPAATEVTIELRQKLNGFFPRFGSSFVRRAAAATLDEALDGLERING